jgi:dolichol kinase
LTRLGGSTDAIEDRRQIEHLVPLGLAFLLPYIDYRGILLLAAIGLLYVLYLSPFWVKVTMRPEESRRGFAPPKLYYVLAVLAVLLLNLDHIYVAAGAWAVLAVGDAFSSLVGRRVRHLRVVYNPRKTWPGAAVFWLCATPAAWLLLIWTLPPDSGRSPLLLLAYAALAAFYCALVETIPSPIDDNVLIVWVGWITLHILFFAQDWRLGGLTGLVALTGWILLLAAVFAWQKGKHTAALPAVTAVAVLALGWPGLSILLVPTVAWVTHGSRVKVAPDRLTWALAVPTALSSLALLVVDPRLTIGLFAAVGFSVLRWGLDFDVLPGPSWKRVGLASASLGLVLVLVFFVGKMGIGGLAIVLVGVIAGAIFEKILSWRAIVPTPLAEGPLLLHGSLFAAFAAGVLFWPAAVSGQ